MKKMQKNLVLALVAMMILSIASVAYAEEPMLYVDMAPQYDNGVENGFENQGTMTEGQIWIQVDGTFVNGGNSNVNPNGGLVNTDSNNIPAIRSEIVPVIAPEQAPAIRSEIVIVPEIHSEVSGRAWQNVGVDATAALNLVASAQDTHSRGVPEIRPEIVAESREVVIMDEMVPLSAGVSRNVPVSSQITSNASHYEQGEIVTLSANAQGGNGNYSYQWMVNRNDGQGFVALEGQVGATYRFTYSAAKLGYSWCVAVDTIG